MISWKSVALIESILWFASRSSSGAFIVRVVFSVLIIGWVKPHDTLRLASPRSSLSLRAQGHRKEWLPPSWASGTLSQSPVQTINLALWWVIGFTRRDQSDTVYSVSVCPSVRRLAPVFPMFCAVSSFIPSAPDVYVLSVHRDYTGIPSWCLIILSSYLSYTMWFQ